jgi:hypothetical protein
LQPHAHIGSFPTYGLSGTSRPPRPCNSATFNQTIHHFFHPSLSFPRSELLFSSAVASPGSGRTAEWSGSSPAQQLHAPQPADRQRRGLVPVQVHARFGYESQTSDLRVPRHGRSALRRLARLPPHLLPSGLLAASCPAPPCAARTPRPPACPPRAPQVGAGHCSAPTAQTACRWPAAPAPCRPAPSAPPWPSPPPSSTTRPRLTSRRLSVG